MDIEEWTKRFGLKVQNKIEDHVVAVVAGVIILIGSALCIIFWRWLKTKHSLEVYGWVWIAAVFILAGVSIFIFWLLKKKEPKISYREDKEILVVLENKLRKYECEKQNQILIDFRECDRKWRFPKGSAQKLLPSLVEKDKTWKIKSLGGNAMTIVREDPTGAVLKQYYKR